MADPHVSLRRLTPELADVVFDAVCDPSLYEHLEETPPASVDALRDRYRFLAAGAPAGRAEVWLNFFIEHDGDQVGTVQATIRADGPTSIAYVVFSAWQRRGHAVAGVGRLLDELGRRGVDEVQVEIAHANAASLAVARRLGFETVGRVDGDVVLRRPLS